MKKCAKDQQNPQSRNQYKALYQLTRKKRANNAQESQQNQSTLRASDNLNKIDCSQKQQDQDSLQKYVLHPPEQRKSNAKATNINHNKNGKQHQIKLSKKSLHNRSHSCPFMNPTEIPIRSIKVIEDESRRTLKKTSLKNYLQRNRNNNMRHHENNAHYRYNKNLALQHKYSSSQLSQQTNTVVVHSLPIQQLSSMLYSLNHEQSINNTDIEYRQSHRAVGIFSKKNKISVSNNNKFQDTPNFNKKSAKIFNSKQYFCINNDLYFNTRLQQQIKMYDLGEDMKSLQKETENVKIKQEVLQKLAQKFQVPESSAIRTDQFSSDECHQDSLLIH